MRFASTVASFRPGPPLLDAREWYKQLWMYKNHWPIDWYMFDDHDAATDSLCHPDQGLAGLCSPAHGPSPRFVRPSTAAPRVQVNELEHTPGCPCQLTKVCLSIYLWNTISLPVCWWRLFVAVLTEMFVQSLRSSCWDGYSRLLQTVSLDKVPILFVCNSYFIGI